MEAVFVVVRVLIYAPPSQPPQKLPDYPTEIITGHNLYTFMFNISLMWMLPDNTKNILVFLLDGYVKEPGRLKQPFAQNK